MDWPPELIHWSFGIPLATLEMLHFLLYSSVASEDLAGLSGGLATSCCSGWHKRPSFCSPLHVLLIGTLEGALVRVQTPMPCCLHTWAMMGSSGILLPPRKAPFAQISKLWWGFCCGFPLQGLGHGRWPCQNPSQGCSLASDLAFLLTPLS